jgi:4-hydroxy-tetrahydrodipicolinate reductase
MKYGIIGASGKMGKEIRGVFDEAGHSCVYTYDIEGETQTDIPEVIIDFSLPVVFPKTIEIVKKLKSALIMGTTGLGAEQLSQIQELSKDVPVVQSFNYSVGIQLLLQCIEKVKGQVDGWDVEITETHHRFKKDKPSGTAIMMKQALGKDVPISSLRLGGVAGEHNIYFGGLGETLTLSHTALSRRTFAEGALKSALFVEKKKNGIFTFRDVMAG